MADDSTSPVQILMLDHERGIHIKSTDPITVNHQTFRQNIYGLHLLAQNIRHHEIEKSKTSSSFLTYEEGKYPDFPAQFNWFSLTFNNHMRLIALVDLMQKRGWTTAELLDKKNAQETKDYCTDYAMSVDADLYRWRNKVAAHSAATDPAIRKDVSQSDTEKLLQQSVWINITYRASFFEVGNMFPIGMTEAEGLPIWQLTKKFEDHRARFWPEFGIPPIPPQFKPPRPVPQQYAAHVRTFGQTGR